VHSYKEALLSSSSATSLELDVRTSTVARPKLCDKERRLCRREDLVPVDMEDGWQVVKSRKQSRCALARRGTSVNLRGRCFNCFSPNHLVASCRCPPRCFRCFKLGHQASRCPAIQAGPLQLKTPGRLRNRLEFDRSYPVGKRSVWHRLEEPGKRLSVFKRLSSQKVSPPQCRAGSAAPPKKKKSVWVRISPAPQTSDQKTDQPSPMLNNCAPAVDQRSFRNKRKRRRSKSKKGKGPAEAAGSGVCSDSPPSSPEAHFSQTRMEFHTASPPTVEASRVLTFTDEMAREEINLRKALFVTIAGTRPVVQGSEVLDEVARSFGVCIDNMSIQHSSPEDFLLFLPDEDTASRIFNGGRLFTGPRFCLMFKRWSRFSHASMSRMSHLVDVQIRGIPEHAWSCSTAEAVLNDSCHIVEIHSDTLMKKSLSSFTVRAWCFDFKKLQRQMTLHIIERGLQSNDKGCLSYKISISATMVNPEDTDLGGLHSSPPDDAHQPEDFEDQDIGNSMFPRPPRLGAPSAGRQSVHSRLGPQPPQGRGGVSRANRELNTPATTKDAADFLKLGHLNSLDNGKDAAGRDLLCIPEATVLDPRSADEDILAPEHLNFLEDEEHAAEFLKLGHLISLDNGKDAAGGNLLCIPEATVLDPRSTDEDILAPAAGLNCLGIPEASRLDPRRKTNSTLGMAPTVCMSEARGSLNPPRNISPQSMVTGPLELIGLGSPHAPTPVLPPTGPVPGSLEMVSPSVVSPHIIGPLETHNFRSVSPQGLEFEGDASVFESGPPETVSVHAVLTLSGQVETQCAVPVSPQLQLKQSSCKPLLKVYSRRKCGTTQLMEMTTDLQNSEEPSQGISDGIINSATDISEQLTLPSSSLINMISRKPSYLLPAPGTGLKRQKDLTVTMPRRSRRVAGIGVEFSMQDWRSKASKKAMRALRIINESDKITSDAIMEYALLFQRPLIQSHVDALAALFGWSTPEELRS
jgi:hypothetical protein